VVFFTKQERRLPTDYILIIKKETTVHGKERRKKRKRDRKQWRRLF
jgi:hypothetical protein